MSEGGSSENIIRQLKLQADEAAGAEVEKVVTRVQDTSKKVVDRMADNYGFNREVVNFFSQSIARRLLIFEPQKGGLSLVEQVQVAAVEGFNDALDVMLRRGHDPKAMHVYERWRREYEEQLREALQGPANL